MARGNDEGGSGMGGVLTAGIITLIIGMLLGGIDLVSQSVEVHSREPDPENIEPGRVIYVKGSRSGRTSWRGKEQAWKAGKLSTLILTEAELNQWADTQMKVKSASPVEGEGSWMDMFEIAVSPVNFRIVQDKLQLATEVEVPGLLPGTKFLYKTTGHFQSHTGGIGFVQESGSLGQAPIGCLPLAGDWFLSIIENKFESMEEINWLVDAFGDLESAEIVDGQLILRRNVEG